MEPIGPKNFWGTEHFDFWLFQSGSDSSCNRSFSTKVNITKKYTDFKAKLGNTTSTLDNNNWEGNNSNIVT